MTELERGQMLTTLNEYVAADRSASGVAIETILDESTSVTNAILSYVASTHADLLALGTHGRSGFDRPMLGSVTEKVLRKAGCPVLTVPPRTPDALPRQLVSIERILCPIDFSQHSMRALDYAASLAQACRARLTVLHVVDIPPDLFETPGSALAAYRASCIEKASAQTKDAIRMLVSPSTLTADMVTSGRSYREVMRVAVEHADLIVMGIRGRGALDLLFFGSTTNHVVREATCPVVTLSAT